MGYLPQYKPSNDPGLKKVAKQFNSGSSKKAAAKKTPQKGSSANPVQRMGLGSIYDKITVDNTDTSGGSAPRSTGAPRVRSVGGGGGRARSYSGPSAAQLAAQAAAAAAAQRQAIIDQYINPSNKLYDTAVQAAESDKGAAIDAYAAAGNDIQGAVQSANAAAQAREKQREKLYAQAARRMGVAGQDGVQWAIASHSQTKNTRDVTDRNARFLQEGIANPTVAAYATQKDNAVGRVQAYQDELNRQRKLQQQQIAQMYGITL